MKIYTKESLRDELAKIRDMGWIPNARAGNDGGIGNTLEDLLGIEENNLPIPNAAEWELKCQKATTNSLITLFHMEPSPRAVKFVPSILLPLYGWPHQRAGSKYPADEMSFRQTINGAKRSNRGFGVFVDREQRKVSVSFAYAQVAASHKQWLQTVKERVGLGELSPQPYWGFDDLFHKAATKLHNCFYVVAQAKRDKQTKQLFFHYNKLTILRELDLEKFVQAIEDGDLLIDFDARTGHNHGTKFRLRQKRLPNLYKYVEEVF